MPDSSRRGLNFDQIQFFGLAMLQGCHADLTKGDTKTTANMKQNKVNSVYSVLSVVKKLFYLFTQNPGFSPDSSRVALSFDQIQFFGGVLLQCCHAKFTTENSK